ncbi:MAG TPA: bacteriocin fulvocin C-related protein [Patescibacteria group bacterium]|nr:bacteriocin fulvocin C-related protein [Patescibacteria group bacterium]
MKHMKSMSFFLVVAVTLATTVTVFGQADDTAVGEKFRAYSEMTKSSKVKAFENEPAKVKAELYRRNFEEALATERLDRNQVRFLIKMNNLMTEAAMTPGTAEYLLLTDPGPDGLMKQAEKIFTNEQLQKIFRVTGIGSQLKLAPISNFKPIHFLTIAIKPNCDEENGKCYCNASWECPSGGYSCEASYGGCENGGSCGWIITTTCHGGCKYTGGEESASIDVGKDFNLGY